jgi:hypothetical protein
MLPDPPQPQKRSHRLRISLVVLMLGLLVLLSVAISPSDEAAFRTFATAVQRWQLRPEFREIAPEYCILGSRAVRTRAWGMPTGRIVMALRSLPWLPKKYAVNPTSQMHYRNFGRGPLIAYLHLCGEQSVPDVIGEIELAAGKSNLSDADLGRVLDSFKMDFPVAKDQGALRSVESLLHDIGGRPFVVRENIGDLLKPDIGALARTLDIDPDPSAMTVDQQQAVLERLDAYVRIHDPELWRTKQVSDFCGGIWAQVFGPPYNTLLVPFLWVVLVSRILLVLALAAIVLVLKRRVIAAHRQAPEA